MMDETSPPAFIDCNVSLSRWPFRRVPLDESEALCRQLKELGITSAWAGNLDAILHRDVAAVNLRTVFECRSFGGGFFRPVGSINPVLPDWRDDVRRCCEDHGMSVLRIYPAYHEYSARDGVFRELLEDLQQRQVVLQVAVRMEDPRTQHPRLQTPDVDIDSLAELLSDFAEQPVVLLNAMRVVRGATLEAVAKLPNVFVEISTLEGVGGVEKLIPRFPWERILFGSHAPFFTPHAAVFKLQESQPGEQILTAIRSGNAQRLLASLVPTAD